MGRSVVNNLYFGTYEHNIDDKARLTIPSKVRSKLGNVVYLSRELDNCLSIRDAEGFSKWSGELNQYNKNDPRARMLQRTLFMNTAEIEVDKAGRINLPENLMKQAGLDKEVVIIGAGDHLEVWDKKVMDKYLNDQPETIEQAAANLERDSKDE